MGRRLAGGSKLHGNSFGFGKRIEPLQGAIAVKGICVQPQHLKVYHFVQHSLWNCGQMVVGQIPEIKTGFSSSGIFSKAALVKTMNAFHTSIPSFIVSLRITTITATLDREFVKSGCVPCRDPVVLNHYLPPTLFVWFFSFGDC